MHQHIENTSKSRFVLLSLFSKEDNRSGIAVYDLESSSTRYVQLVDFSKLPGRICHLRGVHWVGEKLYAVSPFALFIFALGRNLKGPGLILEKTICLREWILGQGQQGNLHSVCVGSHGNTLHITFNAQNAIDTLDLEGNFIRRDFLWDIAPQVFKFPDKVSKGKSYRFGTVRHIFKDQYSGIILATSFLNDGNHGALIALDSGAVLLETSFNPHGAFVHQGQLYLSNIEAGLVQAYPWPASSSLDHFSTIFRPVVDESRWPDSIQNVRGLTVLDDRLVCGICHFGKTPIRQIPPRLVEFSLHHGGQISEHFLPDFVGLQKAQVYSVNSVPSWLANTVCSWTEPKYFLDNQQFKPQFIDRGSVSSLKNDEKCFLFSHDSKQRDGKYIVYGGEDDESHEAVCPVPTIKLENVDLFFLRRSRSLFGINKNLKKNKYFWALKNVTFTLYAGETVGVIGRNGSGKSTLSLVCAGVYVPDSGTVNIYGRVQLLALGVGFKKELTGRDNVFLSASLLGLSRKRIRELFSDIETFAELGEFMDEPVHTYSSGMKSKLGFAVATAVEPEILILDEAMSVGDKSFKDKAMARMRVMQQKAKSVLIVSHNPGEIRKLCSRVLWMEKGRLMMDGDANTVVHAYENFCKNPEKWLSRNSEYLLGTV